MVNDYNGILLTITRLGKRNAWFVNRKDALKDLGEWIMILANDRRTITVGKALFEIIHCDSMKYTFH